MLYFYNKLPETAENGLFIPDLGWFTGLLNTTQYIYALKSLKVIQLSIIIITINNNHLQIFIVILLYYFLQILQ